MRRFRLQTLLLTALLLAALPGAGPWRAVARADTPTGGVRLAEVLAVVAEEHEARGRLQPAALLEGALQSAAEAIAPLLVERREGTFGPSLHLRLGPRETALPLGGLRTLKELEDALHDARAFIASALAPGAPPAQLDTLLAEGALQALDPHSALLSAAAYGDFQSQASGRIGGLGMLLHQREGHLTVESVLPESPAARAGVRPLDRILQIGGHTALQMPVEEALGLIRGRVGTLVSLLILRPDEPAPRQLILRRSDLHFASVEGRLLGEGPRERSAYVRVRSFQDSTTAELREHLNRLRVGSTRLLGIVLDLRDNPGGVLEQAIRVADLFLERGTIVTMRGPRIQPEAVPARWYRSVTSAPLIVLVNHGTASAAEIVAGALKHNHRALLVGRPTFGKNSIQSVFPLSGGNALKLTVARFFPEGERSIEGTGVLPHLLLRPVRLPAERGSPRGLLRTALGTTAADLGAVDPAQPLRELPYLAVETETDYALALALRLLRRNAPQSQTVLLANALEWAQSERRREDQRIVARLARDGADWSAGNGGPGGQAELVRAHVELRSAPEAPWAPLADGARVPGGSEMRLTLTLRNAGALPLHRVLAVTESEARHLDGLELPVGRLPAGGSHRTSVQVTLPVALPQGLEPVRLRIYDGRGQLHYLATLFLPQQAPPHARLRLAVAAFDDGTGGSRGNGDGRPQPGEVLALRVRLTNVGQAPTGSGRYWLGGSGAVETRLLRSWQPFGSVAPGQDAERFLLLALGDAQGLRPLDFSLNLISDRMASPELSWPFRIGAGAALPRLTLQAPRLELSAPPPAGEATRAILHGWAQDDAALRDVLVYRNGHKVLYAAPAEPDAARLPLRLELPLAPGRNLVRVVARDREGLESSRTYVLWRGRGQGFPLADTAPGGA